MRYITNRIATNGFCALERAQLSYRTVYDDCLRSLQDGRCSESRARSLLHGGTREAAFTSVAAVDKQSSTVRSAPLVFSKPRDL